MTLKLYRKKRDFSKTTEPSGSSSLAKKQRYIIQKHAASHLHYDFRLEIDGVLKSWAVPKGPCLDPKVKRLAVHVEDHPLSYANFEGIIPKGEYGGGTVLLWDQGYWTSSDNLKNSLKKGHMQFILHGEKLQGSWHLVRLKDNKNWLLIKSDDEYSKNFSTYDITKKLPLSVKSGKNIKELTEQPSALWRSSSPSVSISKKKIPEIKKTSIPKIIKPQLCKLAKTVPLGEQWLYEIKFDGYRLICYKNLTKLASFTRNHLNWLSKFPALKQELQQLPVDKIILDGELVVLDDQGVSNFQLLQNAIKNKTSTNLKYYAFDLLYYEGYSLLQAPLIERKKLLEHILQTYAPNSKIFHYSEHIEGKGTQFFQMACKNGLEGIISKDKDSLYEQIRSPSWVKVKCQHRQEFIIVGYTKPKGARNSFGALLVGYYNDKKKLLYAGRVGTGFTEDSLKGLIEKLKKIKQDRSPLSTTDNINFKGVQWVKPTIIIEVEYLMFTDDGILRHAAFKGIREDKKVKEIILETVKPTKKTKKSSIEFTHLNKLLYPKQGITKQDLVDYYEAMQDYILPYVVNRPLTIVRCPNGQDKECFYQKHLHEKTSPYLHSISIEEKHGFNDYLYINNLDGLLMLVQLGVLELHPWGCKIDKIERPDSIIFDLDPGPELPWKRIVQAAYTVQEHLTEINLKSFVRTSGGKGLHIVIPIARRYDWNQVKNFTHVFADTLVKLYPHDFISTMSKEKRKDKIFIDYLRNGRGATAVANYSTRARPGAPVALPLAWDEIEHLDAQQSTIKNVPNIVANRRDPWDGFLKLRQLLPLGKA